MSNEEFAKFRDALRHELLKRQSSPEDQVAEKIEEVKQLVELVKTLVDSPLTDDIVDCLTKVTYKYYRSLVDQGFSEEQAYGLLNNVSSLAGVLNKGKK